MQYTTSVQNEAVALCVGFLRQAAYLGRPEMNRNYSEGDIWETWQHAITALSEIAWAGLYQRDENFIPSYNTHKSEPDVGVWEVRYAFPKDGQIPGMRFSEGVDNPESPYVLLSGGPVDKMRRSNKDGFTPPPFEVHGWMWGHECMRPEFETKYSTPNRRKFLVPTSNLRSIEEVFVLAS